MRRARENNKRSSSKDATKLGDKELWKVCEVVAGRTQNDRDQNKRGQDGKLVNAQ
jgi:hypothetical protein